MLIILYIEKFASAKRCRYLPFQLPYFAIFHITRSFISPSASYFLNFSISPSRSSFLPLHLSPRFYLSVYDWCWLKESGNTRMNWDTHPPIVYVWCRWIHFIALVQTIRKIQQFYVYFTHFSLLLLLLFSLFSYSEIFHLNSHAVSCYTVARIQLECTFSHLLDKICWCLLVSLQSNAHNFHLIPWSSAFLSTSHINSALPFPRFYPFHSPEIPMPCHLICCCACPFTHFVRNTELNYNT